jgi:hypothetical protein
VTFTLLDETRATPIDATVGPRGVRLSRETVHDVLGWELTAEGLCRGGECRIVSSPDALVRDGGVDLATLADVLGRPLALDVEAGAACLGAAADVRADRLRSLDAPGFVLPDLAGRPHALEGWRGTKVLLLAWASW